MTTLAVRPQSPALRPFVESLHCHEMDLPFSLERIIPSGQAHLMVNLASDEFRNYRGPSCDTVRSFPGAILAGPHARPTVLDTHAFVSLVAVQFRPGAAAPFFPLPLSETRDQLVGLEHLWCADGHLLRERLLQAPGPSQKLAIMEAWLLRHMNGSLDPAIPWAVAALRRSMPVAAVAAQLGWTPKTLTRRFTAQTGITPRRFARVCRLQAVLRAVRQSTAIDWCRLAAEHGFFDQAHLAHEFRALAGIAPSEYRPASPRRGNHIPIPPA